jgi:hypothetical protein
MEEGGGEDYEEEADGEDLKFRSVFIPIREDKSSVRRRAQ